MAAAEQNTDSINTVQLDGLVVLKIIQHCTENVPEVVTGQLLGLDVVEKLEVTNCFPFPSTEGDDDNDAYQLEMLECLRTVNVDCNVVGWYQSALIGSFLSQSIIDIQYHYQKKIPSSVVVVYDPFRTTDGRLALKAYRLTSTFMKVYAKGDLSHAGFADFKIDSTGIMEEIPIKVHNSHLVHGFLYELRENKNMNCDFDRVSMGSDTAMKKSLRVMSNCIDDYSSEQSKFQFIRRQILRQKQQQTVYLSKRTQENDSRKQLGQDDLPEEDYSKNPLFKPIVQPSRLETFIIANHVSNYCDQVGTEAALAFHKLYATKGMHGEETQ